jgi:hypothetical protein
MFITGVVFLMIGALISRHLIDRFAAKAGNFFEITEIVG